jgi:hypothetical protein
MGERALFFYARAIKARIYPDRRQKQPDTQGLFC